MKAQTRLLLMACVVIGALYLAKGLYRGVTFTHGDFYFTLPGEYARRLNPTLWNSPDMQQAKEYNDEAYIYGPTQYLVLFPIVFLDSYASIASMLLVVYPFVLVGAWYALTKLLQSSESSHLAIPAALFAVVFAFLPLTQALIQREFEVVGFLLLVLACLATVSGREATGGVAIAALAWFKYWPVVFLVSFLLHRRVRGLAAFAVASLALLLAAHILFDLQHFVIAKTLGTVGGLIRPFGTGDVLYPVIERGAQKSDFCRQWIWGRGTQADMRWVLCGIQDRVPAMPAQAIFFAIVAATSGLLVWGAYLLQKGRPDPLSVKWGTIWEFSVLAIAGSAFVHAHYYYFIVFLLPLGALLYWYLTYPQPWRKTKLAAWACAYVLLNAFIVPISWVSSLLQRDAWELYLDSGLCLLGTLLLLALVLWEFMQLTVRAPRALAAV